MSDSIQKIKNEKLLTKREGREFLQKLKAKKTEHGININVARQKMGMVFQHFNLFNNMTVLQNLTMVPINLKLKTKEEAEARAMELLQRIKETNIPQSFPADRSNVSQL